MKITKKLLSVLLAFTLVIGLFLAPTQVVNAEEGYGAVPSKVRIYTSSVGYFSFDLPAYGYSVANLKANSSKIKVKQTYYHSEQSKDEDGEVNSNYTTISLYTQKEGTYKLSFDIVDTNGAKVSSHKVNVYARNDSAFKTIKLGKNTVKTFDKTSSKGLASDDFLLKGKSGKVQVKMAKGYKLKKIEYGVYNKAQGETVYTTVKNNAKITYGTEVSNSEYTSKYSSYMYWSKPAVARTYVTITYVDKYTKTENTQTFSFYQWVK